MMLITVYLIMNDKNYLVNFKIAFNRNYNKWTYLMVQIY